jgi:hypothetical protein
MKLKLCGWPECRFLRQTGILFHNGIHWLNNSSFFSERIGPLFFTLFFTEEPNEKLKTFAALFGLFQIIYSEPNYENRQKRGKHKYTGTIQVSTLRKIDENSNCNQINSFDLIQVHRNRTT